MINREAFGGWAEWEMKQRAVAESIYFTWLLQERRGPCFISDGLGVSVHKLEGAGDSGGDGVRKSRQVME